jgi:7-alpha-hydroxysteroid dehydrogenase
MLERFLLTDQVVVITGGGKGIGAATAEAAAEAGADVVVTARTKEDVDGVAEAVRAKGRRALAIPGDVNDLDFLAELVDRTVSELGGIDVVVNNAGGSQSKPLLDTTVAALEHSFHFNISSPFELVRLSVPHILARGGGAIVNIGSVAGRNAPRGSFTHSLMKAAVGQMTRLMAAELSPRIRVNAVLPGAIETASFKTWAEHMPAEMRDQMIAATPMRRNGVPEDIAAAVLYFMAPASSWVTGKLLDVDGGVPGPLFPSPQADL